MNRDVGKCLVTDAIFSAQILLYFMLTSSKCSGSSTCKAFSLSSSFTCMTAFTGNLSRPSSPQILSSKHHSSRNLREVYFPPDPR